MRLPFSRTLTRIKSAVGAMSAASPLNPNWGGWTRILEAFPGAWQRNIIYSAETVLTFYAVYACVTLIASDIGKLRIRLVQQDADGIWTEVENPAYSPVLRKPNRYQTRIRFFEHWMLSKLIHGNTYVLKYRDQRGVVTAMVVLDPTKVRVLVAPDGEVFYQLSKDNLSGADNVTVPASEIIHDIMNPLFHPLCGVSPIIACGLSATLGQRVQENSARFFGNDSRPSGLLTGPMTIPEETAKRLQKDWQENFSGENFGKVAVLGNGLEYKAMAMTAEQSQLIEQLKLSAENACTAFKVPGYKVGIGSAPTYNNIEALNQEYYSQTLQNPIESIELLLDEGLEIRRPMGTEFDLDDLLRMDTPSRVKAAADSIGSGGMSPDEARKKYFGLGRVAGGATPYLQQQNYSLAALAKRDAQADPFSTQRQLPVAPDITPPDDEPEEKSVSLAAIQLAIRTKTAERFAA